MSSLQQRLQTDLVTAMKAREKQKVSVLRMLSARIKDAVIEKRSELDDAEVQKLLLTYAKQREDGLVEARKAEREDLAAQEEFELKLVRAYLPEPLSDAELSSLVGEVVASTGAATMKDMGRVMKAAIDRADGRADGNRISAAVKSHLSGA
jgi:uncharacterized protein